MIIVGAGVTLSATAETSGKPLQRITWNGLIKNGLDYLVDQPSVSATNGRIKRAYEALQDGDSESLLDAANTMAALLRQKGKFATWLESVFDGLKREVRHPAILEALKALHQQGATLLTTNYDDLLETFCGLPRVGRSSKDEVLKFKRGDLDGVFHVHGSYHDAHEVVLDATDYYQVRESAEVQSVLRNFVESKMILFVGCGSGLEDPNFRALLNWASEQQENIPNRHCLLVKDDDLLDHRLLVRLKYGPGHEHLAPYFHKLLDVPPQSTDAAEDSSESSLRE